MTLDEIIASMERALEARTATLQPQRGMRVPYHGELASAPPSVLRDVRCERLKEVK